ncbi:MAG: hypothetical protein IPK32_15575 [Verrucomicrobiaceae bacterium]|nr:hypothetical protein [Verrucomicrobiaceae bacterium]
MIAGQLIGGRLGAGMAIRHGAGFIRIIFIAVVFTMVENYCGSSSPPAKATCRSIRHRHRQGVICNAAAHSVSRHPTSPQNAGKPSNPPPLSAPFSSSTYLDC